MLSRVSDPRPAPLERGSRLWVPRALGVRQPHQPRKDDADRENAGHLPPPYASIADSRSWAASISCCNTRFTGARTKFPVLAC